MLLLVSPLQGLLIRVVYKRHECNVKFQLLLHLLELRSSAYCKIRSNKLGEWGKEGQYSTNVNGSSECRLLCAL